MDWTAAEANNLIVHSKFGHLSWLQQFVFFLLLIPLSNLLGTGKLREKNNKKQVSVSEQNSNRLNESLLQTTAGQNQIVSKAGGTHLYFQTLIRLIVATVIKQKNKKQVTGDLNHRSEMKKGAKQGLA